MRPAFAFFILLAGICATLSAQNLVPNSSFETNTGCPGGPCEWQRATSWNNLNMLTGCGAYGTPDYYHTCGAGFSHLPNNGFLTCTPHTGNAVMGFLTWSGTLSPNFREMVSARLTSPMIVGQSYTVSFWICNAFTPYYGGGSNHVGLDFSTTPLTQGGSIPNLVLLTPEYEIPGVFFSNPWVNYTFNITATAAWEYITFGNFFNDAATTATLFYTAAPAFRCYYFLDDISIQPAVILPLKLGRPAVSASRNGSSIAWEASDEQGIVRYDVERSAIADDNFEQVATTSRIGSGSYALPDDALPGPGTWYYRVKATDANGQMRWSEVVAFEFEPSFPLISSIYPNPASSDRSATLQAWFPKSGWVNVDLLDLHGRLISSLPLHHDAGTNVWTLPSHEMAAGTYLVRLRSPLGIASRLLIVE